MADERQAAAADAPEPEAKPQGKAGKGKKRLLFLVVPAVLLAAGGGYYAWATLSGGAKGRAARPGVAAHAKPLLFSMDPFVVNLSEPGRYLKVTMQFELSDAAAEPLATEKMPILRDAVISLIGSQPYDLVASPEGKLHLKEEILVRANAAAGREIFRNLYFTDFVMQ